MQQDVKGFRTYTAVAATAATARISSSSGHRAPAYESKNRSSYAPDPLRRALRLPPPRNGAWPWVQPSEQATRAVALVLYGKIGTLETASSWLPPDGGDRYVVQLAHASHRRNVLAANPHAY